MINSLILWRLKKFCDEYGLDYQEIDDQLDYWENLEHLRTLTMDTSLDMNLWKAAELKFLQYYREHFLEYYVDAVKMGETKSADVGPPIYTTGDFSLAAYTQKT